MRDLYGSANFFTDVAELTIDCIKRSIESKYDYWHDQLSRQGAGSVRVSHNGKEIAHGSIAWWVFGNHSLTIN